MPPKKNKITGSTTDIRLKHLIATGAFAETERENATEVLHEFELEQKGALIQLAPGKFTVQELVNNPPPRRGSKNYPEFSDHSKFSIIPSMGKKHLVIMDGRKSIFAYRFPIMEAYIEELEKSDSILPVKKSRAEGTEGKQRGGFMIREYAEWADYSTHTYMTNAYTTDLPYSKQWKERNTPLFQYCSERLRLIAPDQWVAMRKLQYTEGRVDKGQKGKKELDGTERIGHVAGIWPGVAINQQQTEDGETHWDFKDGRGKFNLAIPYGQWEGGYLVLWQLKKKIQVSRGEGLMFLGSAIAHNVVDITGGVRNSLDLFCHQSNFDARRTDKIHKNQFQNWNTGATVAAKDRKKEAKKEKRKIETKVMRCGLTREEEEEARQRKRIRKEFDKIDELDGEVSEEWLARYKTWKGED